MIKIIGSVVGAAIAVMLLAAGIVAWQDWGMHDVVQSRIARLEAADKAEATAAAASAAAASAAQARVAASPPAGDGAAGAKRTRFEPPPHLAMPDDEFGRIIRLGYEVFTDTPNAARRYVGNSMRCSSCHLDAGRLADSAPLWAAWVSYPAWRGKNQHVNTFAERLQGCFRYSMNGTPPPAGDPVLVALESYAYWLASGAPVDPKIAGRGYPDLPRPAREPDFDRGKAVYAEHCALCHGADGAGQRTADGHTVFPALWGDDSYNWGAGMSNVDNAAAFIHANMPLGLGGTLREQHAWDVALYIDSQPRPQDPRWTGSVAETRRRFHDSDDSMYGRRVGQRLLGDTGPPRAAAPAAATAATASTTAAPAASAPAGARATAARR